MNAAIELFEKGERLYRESRKFCPDNSNYLRTVLRTGNLASSVRTSSIASVALCSDTITTNPHVFKVNVGNGFQWIVAIAIVQ